jgi:membrane-bound lytic murein transglycosylase D
MKKLLAFITLLLCAQPATWAQSELSIPEAPKKIEFANILIELDPVARKNVNAEIRNLLTPQNRFLDQKLERMQWYFPIIERILEEENVPEDFKYIAVLESSLLPEAVSSSNAVGFWQFKDITANEMGLKIDNNQDDRKNIHLSTRAAVLYIKRNNLVYKNWVSSVLTYLEGATGALSKIPEEWTFASEIKFDENTHPYLIKALAHRIAFEHRLDRIKDSPRKFIELPAKDKTLADISSELLVDITELKKYNAWLLGSKIPIDKEYKVLILTYVDEAGDISKKIIREVENKSIDASFPELKRITQVTTSTEEPIIYEINGKKGILAQPGDEVALMTKKAKTKISKFLKYNDMTDKDLAKVGHIYYLQKKAKKAKVPFHTVNSEETMWDISQMYGVQMKRLLKYNRMKKTQRLQTGRVIWMQKTRPKNTPIEILQEKKPVGPESQKTTLPINENYGNSDTLAITKNKEATKLEEIKESIAEVFKKENPASSSKREIDVTSDGLKLDDPLFGKKQEPEEEPEEEIIKIKPSVTHARHQVKPGETLFSIANKYKTTVEKLRKLNNLSPSKSIRSQQLLVVSEETASIQKPESVTKVKEIPSSKVTKEETSIKTTETQTKATANRHAVANGETLFSIANKYGVSVKDIQLWNDLKGNSISVGQQLIVSKANKTQNTYTPPAGANSTNGMHKVAAGETLFSISNKYGIRIEDLKRWNGIQNNTVKLGENLIIRKK